MESMGNLREEGSVFLEESMLQFFRPRYMLSWPVLMKFTRMLDQGNALVFALTALRAAKTTSQLVR